MNETNQLSNYFEWSCSIDSVRTMDDLICLMYRNVSYHTSVVEIKKTNWWAVAILRLESNRWWIYSAFQPSILPLQTIQSHDSNSADSRFAIHVRPTTVFFHRSTNDTQFPRSSFFLFSFFFPPATLSRIGILLRAIQEEISLRCSVVQLQCEPR